MPVDLNLIQEKARNIKLLAMDVDGVLTAGEIIYTAEGHELKIYNVKDGLGLSLCKRAGILTAIITGRDSVINEKRAVELEIPHLFQGVKKKLPVLQTLLESHQLSLEQVAYIGDDLPDIEVLEAVGLSACPADAVSEVQKISKYVCHLPGGRGAVRELVDIILKAQGTHPIQ